MLAKQEEYWLQDIWALIESILDYNPTKLHFSCKNWSYISSSSGEEEGNYPNI